MRSTAHFIENYKLIYFFFLILSDMQFLFCIVNEGGWDLDLLKAKFTMTGKIAGTWKNLHTKIQAMALWNHFIESQWKITEYLFL